MSIKSKQDIAAKEFVEHWKGKGQEDEHGRSYWLDMLQTVFGVENPTQYIEFEKKVKSASGSTTRIDAFIPSERILIEQKSIDKDLRKAEPQSDGSSLTPFEQAMRYRANLSFDEQPRWIIVCNFKEIMVHNMQTPNAEPVSILLENFEKDYSLLSFLVDNTKQELRQEMKVSIDAGERVGRLYDSFLAQFGDDVSEADLHSLNVLCVRLVFCLYAEDAGLFAKDQFVNYLQTFKPENMRIALRDLFSVLDTPIEKRDRFLEDKLKPFPYVNGALFKQQDNEVIPPFTEYISDVLINHAGYEFDWSDISPTIFGAVFESTLNQETRHDGGMHYTSVENIHKVIDPLFLNALYEEFESIKNMPAGKQRTQALIAFQDKLASLTFFDPACGSGNFLTETYLSLRRLENKVIACLHGGQAMIGIEEFNPIKVSIHQFYGIEINDFAASVATTALWIAEYQMLEETMKVFPFQYDFLPLKSYSNIKVGNSLHIDWTTVVPENLSYIIGNPPFLGARVMNESQKSDMILVFGEKWKNVGNMDYVCGWYKKASDLMKGKATRAALVSTNSVSQGEQVANLWQPLFEDGIKINFAYRTFKWGQEDNQTTGMAHVHCVIIGFSHQESKEYAIYTDGQKQIVKNINAYLLDAPNGFIVSRSKPICDVPEIGIGNKPIDGGNYLFSLEEMNSFLKEEPASKDYFRPFYGAEEFIHQRPRYCLWLGECSPAQLKSMPKCMERVQNVRNLRLESKSAGTRKLADTPTRFHVENMPSTEYILIPCHSSEKRMYIPMGYLSPNDLSSNAVQIVPDATLFHFGILTSSVHMAWMRAVCGRLETRYRYSKEVVYNNFVWADVTDAQKQKISDTAQAILDARAKYPDSSLADLYDETLMPIELRKAHQANDKAVMEAYGFKATMSESDIVAELFKLYEKMTKK